MINENTVLVLGAGASAPYGFPSGRQLLYEIVRFIDAGESGHAGLERYGHLLDAGFSADELASFRDVLRLSKQPSVDALLEKRPDFVRVGKAAIAAGLIPYEAPEVIRQAEEPKSGWYGSLRTAQYTTITVCRKYVVDSDVEL